MIWEMRRRLNTYTAYSIGCGVVWAAILTGARGKDNFDNILLGFLGWVSGWTSATIARRVYPPPKAHVGRGSTTSPRRGQRRVRSEA